MRMRQLTMLPLGVYCRDTMQAHEELRILTLFCQIGKKEEGVQIAQQMHPAALMLAGVVVIAAVEVAHQVALELAA